MFQVSFYVDDKKLAKVMWSLDGQIAGMPTIVPVKGAEVKGTKIKPTTNGTSPLSALQWAVETSPQPDFTTSLLRDLYAKGGGNRLSGNTAIKALVDRGCLKSAGRGHYKRIEKKA